jgi:hypothetical protein
MQVLNAPIMPIPITQTLITQITVLTKRKCLMQKLPGTVVIAGTARVLPSAAIALYHWRSSNSPPSELKRAPNSTKQSRTYLSIALTFCRIIGLHESPSLFKPRDFPVRWAFPYAGLPR